MPSPKFCSEAEVAELVTTFYAKVRSDAILAMRSFGLSAPGPVVQTHFGFDVAHVVAAARRQLDRQGTGVFE